MANPEISTPNVDTHNQNGAAPAAPSLPAITQGVLNRFNKWVTDFRMVVPADYVPANALIAARLTIEQLVDKDKNPILTQVTHDSVASALFDMLVQGLDPSKKHCYFIKRGNQLTLFRSYFGDIALAQRVRPDIEVYFSAIYEGDEVEFEKMRGKIMITAHRTALANQDKAPIGAYAGATVKESGEDFGCVMMTAAQIRKSWTMNPQFKEGKPHTEFTDQMYIRTAVRKFCKTIINTSTDKALLEAVNRSEDDALEAEIESEVSAKANVQPLELPERSAVLTEAPQVPAEPKPEPVVIELVATPEPAQMTVEVPF